MVTVNENRGVLKSNSGLARRKTGPEKRYEPKEEKKKPLSEFSRKHTPQNSSIVINGYSTMRCRCADRLDS